MHGLGSARIGSAAVVRAVAESHSLWRFATSSIYGRSSCAVLSHNKAPSALPARTFHRPLTTFSRFFIHLQTQLRVRVPRSKLATSYYTPSRMASTASTETPEWSAQRVRDTFLKYFEDRGHTFGKLSTVNSLCIDQVTPAELC